MQRHRPIAVQPHALPPLAQALFVVFFVANLLHFVHNAQFIEFYPGMPAWLTREKVYLAWLAGAGMGLAGLLLCRIPRLSLLGMVLVAAFGALGIDGLAHYTLALCSEHTLATNLTIWFEVLTGLALLLTCTSLIGRSLSASILMRR